VEKNEDGTTDPTITIRAPFKRVQIDPEQEEIVMFVAKKRNRNHKLDRYIEG
jgi:hypothetical protein